MQPCQARRGYRALALARDGGLDAAAAQVRRFLALDVDGLCSLAAGGQEGAEGPGDPTLVTVGRPASLHRENPVYLR